MRKENIKIIVEIALFLLLDVMIVVVTGREWWELFTIGIGLLFAYAVLFLLEMAGFQNRILTIMCVVIICLIPSFSDKIQKNKSQNQVFFSTHQDRAKSRNEPHVWICTGPQSKKYHNDPDCKGLQSCSGVVNHVLKSEAEDMGRTPCGYCYGDAVPDW